MPWYSPRRTVVRVVILLVLGYAAIGGLLYFQQNALEYPRVVTGGVLSTEDASVRAGEEGLKAWNKETGLPGPQGYVHTGFDSPAPRGTIIVFHGNGAWAVQRTAYVDAFRRRGFRTFLYEYPGYGGRPGVPHESNIVPDGRKVIRMLAPLGPVYVWGESLGSGVAASVCADATLPVRGVVLVTPWDTIANVGSYRYPFLPIKALMIDKYDSIANLEHFHHPICVVRSTNDTIIPPALTLNLFAHLPDPKKLILHEGYGHDNWPSKPELAWWDDALDFVAPRTTSASAAALAPPSPAR